MRNGLEGNIIKEMERQQFVWFRHLIKLFMRYDKNVLYNYYQVCYRIEYSGM